mmetsp:Transcript_100148/g.298899  ORF Transcript_100148/g.298899 Transcript_100148/m.298899 type:complete len:264 (+) Transcript_100148:694-1485(+)
MSLLALAAAELGRRDVVHALVPRALDHVVHVRLEVSAVLAKGLGPHGRQTPGRVRLEGDALLRDDVGLAQAKHAEIHLATTLVVSDLELKEGESREHRGAVFRHPQNLLEVRLLIRHDGGMVLPNEDRGAAEVRIVRVQEEVPHLRGGVLGVEAVDKAPLVGPPEVVPGRVVHGVRVLHRVPQLQHLPQAWLALEAVALGAAAKREGHGEVRRRALHTCLLLCGEDGIEGADERLAEVLRLPWKALESPFKLQVWLVHEDDHP